MRPVRMVIAMLAVGLLAGHARAGIYNLDDPLRQRIPPIAPLPFTFHDIQLILEPMRAAATVPVIPDQPVEKTRQDAAELEAIAADKITSQDRLKLAGCYLRLGRPLDAVGVLRDADQSDFRVTTYLQLAELESKEAADLTTTDRINLGACYLRVNRGNDAIRVLSAADQSSFLVLANLAAGYQAVNELERAVAYEDQALAAWPAIQPGWNNVELAWYRRAEGYYLKLLQSRLRESRVNPANKPPETMDVLFEKPRHAGAEYQPFAQPWTLWGDLPPDGYQIVAQLLLWAPKDDRLYWQLGEILNTLSPGTVPEAAKIFDELSFGRKLGIREFMEHRSILHKSLDLIKALGTAYANNSPQFEKDLHYLMLEIAPRGLLSSPGVGDACNEIPMAAVDEWYTRQEQQQAAPPPPPPASQPRGWQFAWQPIFVGFAAGVIVATLIALQWMEWRRRRLAAAHAVPPLSLNVPSQRTEPAVHDAGAIRTDAPAAPHRMEGTP